MAKVRCRVGMIPIMVWCLFCSGVSFASYLDSGWTKVKAVYINTTMRSDTTVTISQVTKYHIVDSTCVDSFFIDGEFISCTPEYIYDSLHPYSTMDTTLDMLSYSFGTVTHFPVLVRLTANNFTFSQSLVTGGGDLRFAKSNGTPLSYEIERWDATNSEAEIWVNVDTVYGNTGRQHVHMYWGKSGATSASNGAAVFDTAKGFTGAWHLGETGTGTGAGVYKDATLNGFNADDQVTGANATGLIGRCPLFDGSDEIITPSSTKFGFDSTQNFMVSGWIYLSGGSTGNLASADDVTSWWNLGCYGRGALSWGWDAGTGDQNLWSPYADDHHGNHHYVYNWKGWRLNSGWHYVVGIQNQQASYPFDLWVDGLHLAEGSTAISHSVNIPMNIDVNIGGGVIGYIDEVRIEKGIARSGDWIKLCYMTQKANQSVVTVEDTSTSSVRNTISQNNGQSLWITQNSFHGAVTIRYSVDKAAEMAQISIHDLQGKMVWHTSSDAAGKPGTYQVVWNGQNNQNRLVSRGVYVVRLTMNNASAKNRVISSKQITYMP